MRNRFERRNRAKKQKPLTLNLWHKLITWLFLIVLKCHVVYDQKLWFESTENQHQTHNQTFYALIMCKSVLKICVREHIKNHCFRKLSHSCLYNYFLIKNRKKKNQQQQQIVVFFTIDLWDVVERKRKIKTNSHLSIPVTLNLAIKFNKIVYRLVRSPSFDMPTVLLFWSHNNKPDICIVSRPPRSQNLIISFIIRISMRR